MILDRTLSPALLDIAFATAQAGERPDNVRRLTVALQNHVTYLEAEGKTRTRPLVVAPELTGWIAHALLLTREATAVDSRGLFYVLVSPAAGFASQNSSGAYPLLEMHNEAGGRSVLVPR